MMLQKMFIPTVIMVQLTHEQRAFVVQKYHETKSYIAVQDAFRVRFPDRQAPIKNATDLRGTWFK